MASAETALKSLICSEIQMDELLSEIEALNEERKGSTLHFVQLALETVDPLATPIIFVSDEIHHGIMGLVAGRLAEHFGKPAIACVKEDGKYVGSARSQSGYHITDAFERISDCFVAFGGHAQAAGFTIAADKFEEFQSRITADAEQILGANLGKRSKIQEVDGLLALSAVDLAFVRQLETVGPFGMGFRKPAFLLRMEDAPKWEFMGSGETHVKFESPRGMKMIAFGLGHIMAGLGKSAKNVGFVVELDRETWLNRESVVVYVRDVIQFS